MALLKRRRAAQGSDARPPEDGSDLSERAICDALRAGKSWAADVFYDRFANVVDVALFRLLGPGEGEREDIAQQALERVIATIVSGRFSHECSLASWTRVVTQNLAIDVLRARGRDRKVFDRHVEGDRLILAAEDNRTPERAAIAKQRVSYFMSALGSVTRVRAETVALHDIWGHNLREIAVLTGVSIAAAQSRLVRGRREILRFIAKKENEGVAV